MSDSIRRSAGAAATVGSAMGAAIGLPTFAATGGLPRAGLVTVGLAVVGRVTLDFGLVRSPTPVMAFTRSLSQRLRETPPGKTRIAVT